MTDPDFTARLASLPEALREEAIGKASSFEFMDGCSREEANRRAWALVEPRAPKKQTTLDLENTR